jgi:hypothetical protein
MAARKHYPASRTDSAVHAFQKDLTKAVEKTLKDIGVPAKKAKKLSERDVVRVADNVIVVGEAYEIIEFSASSSADRILEWLPRKYDIENVDTTINYIYFRDY